MMGISCTHFSRDPPKDWLDRIVGEFELWEIVSEADHNIIYNFEEFAELLPCYDLSYQVHAPFCEANPAAFSPVMREASIRELVSVIKAASDLDIPHVTVHPGTSPLAVGGLQDRGAEIARESMRDIDAAAKEYGVTVGIENMPELPFMLCRRAEDLARMIEGTDLGVCFDIGHANTAGQIDAMFDLLGDRVTNVHIHDNRGMADEHLTIGDGNIDFERHLPRLEALSCNLVIESRNFESAQESLSRIS
ncbi:MAG: sugar phosphate isomerase/epimerase [Thermoplasmata archaeon]|jgi:sugar phosphate isomerase/epimerase|nr:sugar phosphate isomerase/epimerase [Thermoplasmata archaeon]